MTDIHPYLIIPTLIPQPTWGGDYIANLKQLKQKQLDKLGQSYELFASSQLSQHHSSQPSPSIQISNPSNPTQTELINHNDSPLSIQNLINTNPQALLGPKPLKQHGPKIDTLIKLTQAHGNSYQLHVRQSTKKWQPKPESWYFFQAGLITLGVKPGINWDQYQQVCIDIDHKAQELSTLIRNKKITLTKARQQLHQFIQQNHSQQFVNRLQVAADTAVDLSSGGIHHSWEFDPKLTPQGNIVYEVQQNVYDPVSTIRAFDQGKIKPDGSVRPLNIPDYFKHIERSPKTNTPSTHFTTRKILKRTSTHTIRQIFSTPHYQLQELTFTQPLSNSYTTTSRSYHHLFARQGNFKLIWQDITWTVTSGFSIFIPAAIGAYTLKPYRSTSIKVLKTYL